MLNLAGQEQSTYKIGLDRESEAVISAHFMHDINCDLSLDLYSNEYFLDAKLTITEEIIFENLIPCLLKASEEFIHERVASAKRRAKENFMLYDLTSSGQVSLAEMLAEVMFDRQFLKGSKSNYSRIILRNQISDSIKRDEPIKMVVPALPYKSASPLKTRGVLPDFSEINFLLSLAEIAKTIDYIYREKKPNISSALATFTVVSDGRRFNSFLHEPEVNLVNYQLCLLNWVQKLDLEKFIKIVDYEELIANKLERKLLSEKNLIRSQIKQQYRKIFLPILDPNNMKFSIKKAIELEPDPEKSYIEGRFIPLFKSLIYNINYQCLIEYTKNHHSEYKILYRELTHHILEPYLTLYESDLDRVGSFIHKKKSVKVDELEVFEYLRVAMLKEAWHATIDYMAEIISDRNLQHEPIISCLPDHIRWTIHAKSGQLAILTTVASGDPVQAWHGAGVFKISKNGRIKLYTLPVLFLEGIGAIPVTLCEEDEKLTILKSYIATNQPLFYIHPNINTSNIALFLGIIALKLTRKRKL